MATTATGTMRLAMGRSDEVDLLKGAVAIDYHEHILTRLRRVRTCGTAPTGAWTRQHESILM